MNNHKVLKSLLLLSSYMIGIALIFSTNSFVMFSGIAIGITSMYLLTCKN